MFDLIGRQDPPAITDPGFYYGFITVGSRGKSHSWSSLVIRCASA
jgi:hypothetical protein